MNLARILTAIAVAVLSLPALGNHDVSFTPRPEDASEPFHPEESLSGEYVFQFPDGAGKIATKKLRLFKAPFRIWKRDGSAKTDFYLFSEPIRDGEYSIYGMNLEKDEKSPSGIRAYYVVVNDTNIFGLQPQLTLTLDMNSRLLKKERNTLFFSGDLEYRMTKIGD